MAYQTYRDEEQLKGQVGPYERKVVEEIGKARQDATYSGKGNTTIIIDYGTLGTGSAVFDGFVFDWGLTLEKISLQVGTAGALTTVSFALDGTDFTTGSVASGSGYGSITTTQAITAAQTLSVNIDSTGSGTNPSDLSAVLHWHIT